MVLLIDVGGTQIKYGIMDEENEDFWMLGSIDTNTAEKEFSVMKRLYQIIDEVLSKQRVTGVAISTAGIVEANEGRMLYANGNIPGYMHTNVSGLIKEKYHLKCSVENDVKCAILGEIYYGGLREVNSAVMFTIGTGVGGAVYLNGDVYRGNSFSAGEIGYSVIGNKTADEVASTTALVRYVQEKTGKIDMNGRWIFEQARKGDFMCVEAIDLLMDQVVNLMINCTCLINPEVFILGGGIMEQKEYLSPIIMKKFQRYKNQFVLERTKIVFATQGNYAGMLGAYRHYKACNK